PRRDADGRRPRRAAPTQARPPEPDSNRPRRGIQGREAVIRLDSLRTRLFAAIVLIVVLSVGLTLLLGALLTRREVEKATLRGVANQADLLAARENNALFPFARLPALRPYLKRQGEVVIEARLDGSSPW